MSQRKQYRRQWNETKRLLGDFLHLFQSNIVDPSNNSYSSSTTTMIVLVTQTGQQIRIDVQPSDTINAVKTKIEEKRGISIKQQLLATNDIELENNQTLSSYNLNNNSTIHLMMLGEESNADGIVRRITVHVDDGSRVTVDIHPSDTLREVKTRIRDQNGIPLNEQFLVIDGVETDENRALASYIKNNSVVHLFRLRDEPIPSPSSHLPPSHSGPPHPSVAMKPLSPFYIACRDNDVPKIKQLLRTVPIEEMNRLEPNGSTALHVACFRGHKEVVELLLKHGVRRSIMNRYRCLPYEEAASDEIKKLFHRIPGKDRYVANSGRVEWLLVAPNTQAISARLMEAITQRGLRAFEESVKQIINEYIKPYFRNDKGYDLLLDFFNAALRENDPKYLVKAYTAETEFYSKINMDLAADKEEGREERQLFIGILTVHPSLDTYRYTDDAYRGMRLSEDDVREYAIGKKVMTKSFLSATTDQSEAERFIQRHSRHNIHGKEVKMGAICRYLIRDRKTSLNVAPLSEYPNEKEILIFPYAVFTVTNVQRITQPGDTDRMNITLTQN